MFILQVCLLVKGFLSGSLSAWNEITLNIYIENNNVAINYSFDCDTQDLIVHVSVLCREILVLS
jgi:hypothetical protein